MIAFHNPQTYVSPGVFPSRETRCSIAALSDSSILLGRPIFRSARFLEDLSALLDSGGEVIGVMEAKLDAVKTFRMVGDIPENVNFPIQRLEVIQFLERNHVAYHGEATESSLDLKVAEVAARAEKFSVPVECLQ